MLSKELIAASTKPLVLSILTRGESYGYALSLEIKRLSGGQIEWSEGMLYPLLHRMEDEALIESFWQEGLGGRDRKYYRIVRAGKRALQTHKQQWTMLNNLLNNLWNPIPNSN